MLSDADMLAAIDIAQLIFMTIIHNQDDSNTERLQKTSVPEIMVSKFTASSSESLVDNLKSAVSCVDGIRGVPIDCLLREADGNYNYKCMSSRDKLNNCLSLSGNQFKHNSDLLYQLYIQYIGTEGHVSNIFKN